MYGVCVHMCMRVCMCGVCVCVSVSVCACVCVLDGGRELGVR